jgi:formylglycine-generating enzyme required for sulfatase activity
MGYNPSYFDGSSNPVEQVSWNDAQEFVKRLNEMEGTDKYRLPSEAEWEYACRAGSTTDYSFGNKVSDLDKYAWYDSDLYVEGPEEKTHPIGQKKPNAWGLYDMHGNVWEWCQDIWHESYVGTPGNGSAFEIIDPAVGASDGADLKMDINIMRVLRGGSWSLSYEACKSTYRTYDNPEDRESDRGFRILREL